MHDELHYYDTTQHTLQHMYKQCVAYVRVFSRWRLDHTLGLTDSCSIIMCGCMRWRMTAVVALQVLLFESVSCFTLTSRATAMPQQQRSCRSARHMRMLDSTGATRKAAAVPTPSQAGAPSSLETRLQALESR
jgi:hypothetical protein